jgi:hypothetical protein
LSPYFTHLLAVVCEILLTIHAPCNFSHLSPCPGHSLSYLYIFGYNSVFVALTMSGWSALICVFIVTALSPKNSRFSVTPHFPILFLHLLLLLLLLLLDAIFVNSVFWAVNFAHLPWTLLVTSSHSEPPRLSFVSCQFILYKFSLLPVCNCGKFSL